MKTIYIVLLSMAAIPLTALTAMLVPLSSASYGQQDQGQPGTLMADDNSMTRPHHDMAEMMGQDVSMSSDQSNGSQDNDTQNKPQSKVLDGIKVDFAAQPVIHTN